MAQSWDGTGPSSGFSKVNYFLEFIFYFLLFPIFPIRFLSLFCHSFIGIPAHGVKICIQYAAYTFSYFTLYVLLVATVVWNSSHSRCDNLEEGTGCRPSALDWTVFIYVIGFDAQEWFDVRMNKVSIARFSSRTRITQVLSNGLLNVYYILCFIGFYADLGVSVRGRIIRISYYVIGSALTAVSWHMLYLVESNALFGTILLSFIKMLKKTVGYFIFLIIALVAAAGGITCLYAAEIQIPGVTGNSTKTGLPSR